jgi:hypothetical protein
MKLNHRGQERREGRQDFVSVRLRAFVVKS